MKLIFAAGLSFALLAGGPAMAGSLGQDVVEELNFARTHPGDYADELRAAQRRSDGGFLYEDPDALAEAIDFLERQAPLPPLRRDARLEAAARVHAAGQGPTGRVGHGGGPGLGQRLQAQGVFAGMSAENISYGYGDPRDVVRQLIVDSGVPSRGHRANIFSRGYQALGVACGGHEAYGVMCVLDFAGALAAR
jgi:hypothetical protein